MDYNLNIKNIKEYILEIYIYILNILIYIYVFFTFGRGLFARVGL